MWYPFLCPYNGMAASVGILTCAQVLMHAIAHKDWHTSTVKESALIVDSGDKNPLSHQAGVGWEGWEGRGRGRGREGGWTRVGIAPGISVSPTLYYLSYPAPILKCPAPWHWINKWREQWAELRFLWPLSTMLAWAERVFRFYEPYIRENSQARKPRETTRYYNR